MMDYRENNGDLIVEHAARNFGAGAVSVIRTFVDIYVFYTERQAYLRKIEKEEKLERLQMQILGLVVIAFTIICLAFIFK